MQPLVGLRLSLLFDPSRQFLESRLLREASGGGVDARRNPIGKAYFPDLVTSRARVNLADLRKAVRWEPASSAYKSWPQASMHKGDLALDEATHENIVTVADGSRYRKNLVTLWMRPPTTLDRRSRDDLGKRRNWPSPCLEDDPVLTNKG